MCAKFNKMKKCEVLVEPCKSCLYVCMYVCMYACMYACICMYVFMYVCTHVYMYYVYISFHVFVKGELFCLKI